MTTVELRKLLEALRQNAVDVASAFGVMPPTTPMSRAFSRRLVTTSR